MVNKLRHVRHGLGSVRPYVHGPVELLDFVKTTFDAVELERHEFGPQSFHVEMQIGDSVLVIEAGDVTGHTLPWTCSIYVYVKDVEAVYQRAMNLGARPISPPADKPYEERQAGFIDAAGNTWWIATFNHRH
jgi:PhnB protein